MTLITHMIFLETLYNVYLKTRRNKRRSEDSVLFEICLEKNLVQLKEEIENREWIADGNYTFVASEPSRNGCREVFAAELGTRVIHHYINESIYQIMEERVFTPKTFNNRIGKGVLAAAKQLQEEIYEITNGYTEDAYIIKWDLKAFFMCIDHSIVMKQIIPIIEKYYHNVDKDELIYMIDRCVNAIPTDHCYKKSPNWKWTMVEPHKSLFNQPYGYGAAIGFLIWQIFVNLYHNHIDHMIHNEWDLHYLRYVDDCVVIVKNLDIAKAFIFPELRKMYKDINVTINPNKFYIQHYSKGVKFVGSTIKFNRMYANNRVVRNAFLKIRHYNKIKNKKKYMYDFIDTLNSYIGLIKQFNSYKIIRKLLNQISDVWYDKYIQWNPDRGIIQPKPHHMFHYKINESYNLGLKKFGKSAKAKYYEFPKKSNKDESKFYDKVNNDLNKKPVKEYYTK